MAVPLLNPHTLKRGDAAVKKNKFPDEPNIIETYEIGNSIIHIADNHIVKTPEEIDKVLDDFHAAGWRIVEEGK
jgi:hypothetical protein